MEIEKKYLVKNLPEDINKYESVEIEQAYICSDPTLRIRKKGPKYIFTYKNRVKGSDEKLCIADEIESEISFDAYMHLFKKADGWPIHKTRYMIPYDGYTIELDVFHDNREGLYLAEVEFMSVEDSRDFVPPDWFGEDVSGDIRYTNSYMSSHEK